MPAISHKYLEKLRREVAAFEQWLAQTQAAEDGSASPANLRDAFTKANSIYIKALELYRTTSENNSEPDEQGERIITPG
jgi:hypothetical protein